MSGAERTLRALADAVIPQDETIGAADVRAEAFLEHYLELGWPGAADVLVAALDGVAAARAGATGAEPGAFESLDDGARAEVVRALAGHEVAEIRTLARRAVRLVLAAFYGEWTGQDEHGALVAVPVGWELTGFASGTERR